jgi:hypothetical protein
MVPLYPWKKSVGTAVCSCCSELAVVFTVSAVFEELVCSACSLFVLAAA